MARIVEEVDVGYMGAQGKLTQRCSPSVRKALNPATALPVLAGSLVAWQLRKQGETARARMVAEELVGAWMVLP